MEIGNYSCSISILYNISYIFNVFFVVSRLYVIINKIIYVHYPDKVNLSFDNTKYFLEVKTVALYNEIYLLCIDLL